MNFEEADSRVKEILSWTPQQIFDKFSDLEVIRDSAQLRELVVCSSMARFNRKQSADLGPVLLTLAMQFRDSKDPMDHAVIWEAICTGSSMISLYALPSLEVLLETGHQADTRLDSLKMIGRIFESYPPKDLNFHVGLAGKIKDIVLSEHFENDVITRKSAIATTGIYALMAMGSIECGKAIDAIHDQKIRWMLRTVRHDIEDLKERWQNNAHHKVEVSVEHQQMIDSMIKKLDRMIEEEFSE